MREQKKIHFLKRERKKSIYSAPYESYMLIISINIYLYNGLRHSTSSDSHLMKKMEHKSSVCMCKNEADHSILCCCVAFIMSIIIINVTAFWGIELLIFLFSSPFSPTLYLLFLSFLIFRIAILGRVFH